MQYQSEVSTLNRNGAAYISHGGDAVQTRSVINHSVLDKQVTSCTQRKRVWFLIGYLDTDANYGKC